MASVNRVFLIGNLTAKPALKKTGSGKQVADLRLALNGKRPTGKSREGSTCFVDVVVWEKQAEICERYLEQGSQVCVEGQLQCDEWTGREGAKHSTLRVKADRVEFLGKAKV